VTIRANRDGRFNPAGALLPVPEFYNLVVENDNATRSYLMNTWGGNTFGLWTHNLTVRGGGGQATLDMNGKTVQIDGALRLGAGGGILNAGAALSTSLAVYAGGTASADVSAPTLEYEGTTFGGATPVGVTFSAGSGQIGAVSWIAFGSASASWNFTPTISSSAITITFVGRPAGYLYRLLRDGTPAANDTDLGSTVSFTLTGGWSQHTMTVEQFTYPSANFTSAITGNGLSIAFTSIVYDGTPGYTYMYDFGDGFTSSTTASPIHEYSNAGNYTVTLIVVDSLGYSTTVSHDISVQVQGGNPPPPPP
jgi:hypothetical protein